MRMLLDHIARRVEEFTRCPLHRFLHDNGLPLEHRLSFVPAFAHFVMSVTDLYGLILSDGKSADSLQRLVNANTEEDEGHWVWFLADLERMGESPALPFTDALRLLFSDSTRAQRMLTYRLCGLGMGASSMERLVLLQCIESASKVTLRAVAPVGRALGEKLGQPLVYIGPHHVEQEESHTLDHGGVRDELAATTLGPEERERLHRLVDQAFQAFTDTADELLAFARARIAGGTVRPYTEMARGARHAVTQAEPGR